MSAREDTLQPPRLLQLYLVLVLAKKDSWYPLLCSPPPHYYGHRPTHSRGATTKNGTSQDAERGSRGVGDGVREEGTPPLLLLLCLLPLSLSILDYATWPYASNPPLATNTSVPIKVTSNIPQLACLPSDASLSQIIATLSFIKTTNMCRLMGYNGRHPTAATPRLPATTGPSRPALIMARSRPLSVSSWRLGSHCE